jgi:CRP-like cAMP-binding protein
MPASVQPSSLGLRRIAFLEGLSDQRLESLARECAWRNYRAGQPIITRAAADRDVHLIIAGRVRVTTYSAAGRQVTFRDIGAGELFGEVAAIDDMPRSADVVALENAMTASMPAAVFRRLLREEPALAERVLRRLASLVRRMSERVIDLSTLGVHQRLHAELLRLAREPGEHLPGAGDAGTVGARQGRHREKGRARARGARPEAAGNACRRGQSGCVNAQRASRPPPSVAA